MQHAGREVDPAPVCIWPPTEVQDGIVSRARVKRDQDEPSQMPINFGRVTFPLTIPAQRPGKQSCHFFAA
jgi:hypothetical protein